MDIFLRLRAGQLFALMVGLPLLIQVATGVTLAVTGEVRWFMAGWVVSMLLIGLFFGWLWTLGTRLAARLPAAAPMRGGWFRAALLLPVAYMGALLLGMGLLLPPGRAADMPSSTVPLLLLLVVPVHLLSMAGIFYALRFVAKALNAVERQRPVGLAEYLGDFFLLWFFPVGLWIIQPRINRLFAPAEQ